VRIVLIRQRPSIGDCLLLGPLVEAAKHRYPDSKLTVITDATYMGGALPRIFAGLPGVDRVELIDSMEWTTETNREIDPKLRGAATQPLPQTVSRADVVLDCNAAFMLYERLYKGNPPYGIAEFWLRHHNLLGYQSSLLPHYQVSDLAQAQVTEWKAQNNPEDKAMIAIVLRAGDSARDWDYDGKSSFLCQALYTMGYLPVTVDPIKTINSPYAKAFIGRPIDQVAAFLALCKLTVTPDTGLLHLSEAVGTPQVALWGIMRPELRVRGYDCAVVPKHSLGYCAGGDSTCKCPWTFQKWSCMRRLSPTMILAGIEEQLLVIRKRESWCIDHAK